MNYMTIPGVKIPRTPEGIVGLLCEYYDINAKKLLKGKAWSICLKRQIAHYLTRTHTDISLGEVGRRIGNKDHATVSHSVKTIGNLLEVDKEIRRDVEHLKSYL